MQLIEAHGDLLRLGPATAALPDAVVDSLRRFHDQLPHDGYQPSTVAIDWSQATLGDDDEL
jgi:hypothetical protein